MDTPGNVLVGRAVLGLRNPNDALAEWSTAKKQAGSYSVKLLKNGSGNAGSTNLEFTGGWGTETFADWVTGVAASEYLYWYFRQAIAGGFWEQIEFRFEDPDSDAWVEVTVAPAQGVLGTALWTAKDLADDDPVGFGGVNEIGLSFEDWGMTWIPSTVLAEVSGTHAVGTADNWILKRVRFELWEPEVARWMHIDTVVLNGVAYTIEPGDASQVGMTLSAPYVDVGYTLDGVIFETVHETRNVKVDETPYPIDRYITSGDLRVTCNMAESSLANLNLAIPGSVRSGSLLTLGGGVLRKFSLRLVGLNPAGYKRQIYLPVVTATGTNTMTYKRAEETIVPVIFEALQPAVGNIFTWVDNEG